MALSSAQEQVLRVLHGQAPAGAAWWDDDLCRLVAFAGCRPAAAGRDGWGVPWTAVAGGQGPLAAERFYPGAPVADSAAALLARPLPDGRDPAPFAGLRRANTRFALTTRRANTRFAPTTRRTNTRFASTTRRANTRFASTPRRANTRFAPAGALTIGLHPLGPLDRLAALLGPERALLALLEEPDACRRVLDRIAAYHVRIAEHYLAAGVGAGWLADDYAGAAGPLLRPALWRGLVLPGLARIIGAYRAAGALCFFHTCGRADELLPDLLAAGVTAFNLESAANDFPALAARFGDQIAFIGCPAWLAGA